MSSIIKVGKVQSSTGNDAVTIADSGAITANGALTASGGIANAGTITAGTLGSSVVVPASVGSSMVLIKSITASDADTEILFQHNNNGVIIDSTYTNYMMVFEGVVNTTSGKNVYVTVGTSSGYDSTYVGGMHVWYDNGSTFGTSNYNIGRSHLWTNTPNNANSSKDNGGLNGHLTLYNLTSSTYATYGSFNLSYYGSNGYFYGTYGSTNTTSADANDRIKINTNSDSFKGGSKISLYGIKDA